MKLSKKNAQILTSAIEKWVEENLISKDQGKMLIESFEVSSFDWKRLAKYSFWVAIICIITSICAIVTDDFLVELLFTLFDVSYFVKALFAALIAALIYNYGIKRKEKWPEKVFSNEAIFFLGVFTTALSVACLGKALDTGSGHFSLLILLLAIVYGILGLLFPSKLVWIFSLLSLGGWFGAETGYVSEWKAYYLGMNYPLRFVLFGLVLTAVSGLFGKWQISKDFLKSTRIMGLLYLFNALWILSIFGNYGSIDEWEKVKQIELFYWSILFGVAAIASIYYGLKNDDAMTRGFGITYLFLNLYTRFFEYFWDSLHKAIFFAILALSFWYLGTKAEKIWHLDFVFGKKQTE
ncbi:MAG: DUF2157 domain-containing protein [Candidatus Schekmanbacteria bacterium]|nr:MAG: DUF2157 domain-containing protein [Candidatus Schekmanbacteria bacterium]